MKFSDSFLDEIRARLPVSTVVSRRVPLKRAGREWKGPDASSDKAPLEHAQKRLAARPHG